MTLAENWNVFITRISGWAGIFNSYYTSRFLHTDFTTLDTKYYLQIRTFRTAWCNGGQPHTAHLIRTPSATYCVHSSWNWHWPLELHAAAMFDVVKNGLYTRTDTDNWTADIDSVQNGLYVSRRNFLTLRVTGGID